MGTGYTRNDTANNIADGNVINASDLDGEFDAVQAAFNATTGHSHDGTTGEGPQIDTGGLADDAVTGAKIDSTTTITAAGFTGPLTGTASNAALLDNIDSTSFLRSDAADTKTSGDLSFSDSVKAAFGNGPDLEVFHDGLNSYINEVGTGSLYLDTSNGANVNITAGDGAESMATFAANGAATLFHDNIARLATTATGIDVTGNATFDDNGKAIFGAGSDLQIYHDGSNSYIDDAGTGFLLMRGANQVKLQKYTGEEMLTAVADGAVTLFYNNAVKLATTSTGIDVTGDVLSDTFTLDNGASDWQFSVVSNNLIISYAGTAKMKLDTSGNLTVTGDVISEGTI
jgi:hypothetical protein